MIELLVVIAIIAILVAVVIASLNTSRQRARDASRYVAISEIQKALQIYWVANGQYPPMSVPSTIDSLDTYLVPTYIKGIQFDLTNVSGATYYRPASNPDSYLIYISTEKQYAPGAYGCRTGMGPVVDSGLYASSPKCQ